VPELPKPEVPEHPAVPELPKHELPPLPEPELPVPPKAKSHYPEPETKP
jgi:hypothetical protein